MKKQIPKILITKTLGFGESEDGKLTCIELQDSQGVALVLMLPTALEGEFLARFQGASLMAAQKRGDVAATQIERLLQIEQATVGVTDDHKIGLRLKTTFGMTIDLGNL